MPQKNQKIARQLNRFDRKKKATKKAMALARATKKETTNWDADFGRTLPHYIPIHELLLKMAKGNIKGKKILHIASSTGLYTFFLQSLGAKAIGFDIGTEALQIAKNLKNKRLVRGDARTWAYFKTKKHFLPFKDGSINIVVSDNFLFSDYPELEYSSPTPASMDTMAEIHRILNKRGLAIINLLADEFSGFHAQLIERMGFEIIKPKQYKDNNLWISPISEMGILVLRKK